MKIKVRVNIHLEKDASPQEAERFRELKKRVDAMSGAEIAALILKDTERRADRERAIGFRP